ncbi:hypothetical protein G647_08182 [Cladophialophora carrionii CBS 160.54]|uniref:Arrestin-like N-terminal domain-containing protein n=1 Tax=Cladophialophora carrionii CBS 160.54 TaxID=1279043 RepID=V9D1J0_9EURO|nr:uncharacterized protein G647_08182 [Cladophialophora carrionii CBS 160.54]ETI20148.1 hypothetical protein G647_08182 [Cladophialophora carrionii CBS 160.54]
MGLTKAEDSPGLSLELDSYKAHYSPGDTISGRVVLNTADEVGIGKVVVSFWGRAKSRIIQQHGQAVTYHRGRTQFFKQELVLYEGQYTHKAGTFSWPFEFVVPEQADPASILAGEKWKPKDHFRGTADVNDLELTLPASCYHSRHMFGRHAECFIEYVLDVTLVEPEGLHHIRGPQSKVSTRPIIFHPLSTPEPIQNYNFVTDQRLFTISTLKLLPEHAGTSLGLRDRARSIFQRDSLPKFSFSLAVQAPSIIQLMHPDPIPFLITATPDLSPGLTTIDTSTSLPTVTLKAAKIELKTYIRCRAAGTFSDSKTYEIPMLSYKTLNQPLTMVRGRATAAEATLNLGQLVDLRLANAKLGSRLEAPLTPNFTTYNVSRSYHLLWELEIECADKTEKFSSVKNGPECTVILPPATVRIDSVLDTNMLLGADLSQAMTGTSAESTGSGSSSGFWHRRSHEGKESSKEKSGIGRPVTSNGGGEAGAFDLDSKGKSKAQEAAEERALARLGEIESAYQRRHQDSRNTPVDDAAENMPRGEALPTQPAIITVTDTEQQLPRYKP